MKISEAIKTLTEVLAQAGDMDLVSVDAVPQGWSLDRERQFDVVAIPSKTGGQELVCALLGTEILCECNEDDPRPRLALVKEEGNNVQN